MKVITRYVSLISVTSMLASGALLAQSSASSSATSGTSDSSRSPASTTRPYNNSSTGRQSSTGTSATSSNDPTGPSSATGSAASLSGSSSGLSNDATTSGALGTRNTTSGSAFSGLADPLVSSIQSGDYNSRAQLASDIEQRLDSQKDALKMLKNEGRQLQGQARSNFNTAFDDVQAREKDLKHNLREARNASPDKWDSVRSELASNYQAFTAALARAQSQVGPSVNYPSSSSTDSSSNGTLNRGTSSTRSSSGTTGSALPNDPAASTTR